MKLLNLFNWVTNLVEAFTFYGGDPGGGGNQTSTSYSTNLPEYAKPFYEELLKQSGKNVFATDEEGGVTGIKPYVPYTGERVAGFNPGQTAVQSEVAGMKTPGGFATSQAGLGYGAGLGYDTAGAGLSSALGYRPSTVSTGAFTAPGTASAYMSPYVRAAIDPQLAYQEKLYGQQNAGDMAGSIGRGTFGGARQALMRSQNLQNQNMNLGNILGQGLNTGYQNAQQQFNADQARSLQAQQANVAAGGQQAALQGQLGTTGLQAGLQGSQQLGAMTAAQQTSDLQRLQAQASSAGEKQALQQKIDDLQYQTAMEQRDWQQKQLEFYSNILRGNAGALGSTQVQYTQGPQQSPLAGLGVGLQGLSLLKSIS
jgi:hypothetical protein